MFRLSSFKVVVYTNVEHILILVCQDVNIKIVIPQNLIFNKIIEFVGNSDFLTPLDQPVIL